MTPKSVMVTGGTGSFGRAFIAELLRNHPTITRIVIYSRDELKQFEMAEHPVYARHRSRLRYFIGDVRDRARLQRALEGVDTVVHAAALKQVPVAEYNPFEAIKTNIIGGQNVIDASLDSGVKRVVALSTDKAAAPINLYGATKLCSDKLFVAANHFKGAREIRFSVVRYGNVMGSRGSVIPLFLERRRMGSPIPVTSKEMTRFNITLPQGVDLVLFALEQMWGGEIFVPKIPSYRIMDVAEAIAPGREIEFIGVRPGEKIHEELITTTDSLNSLEFEDRYVILPSTPLWDADEYAEAMNGKACSPGWSYNSGTNDDWLTVQQLRELVRSEVNTTFEVND